MVVPYTAIRAEVQESILSERSTVDQSWRRQTSKPETGFLNIWLSIIITSVIGAYTSIIDNNGSLR